MYAEKLAALNEYDLDRILTAAEKSGKQFHEMATTAFEPWVYGLYEFMKSKPLGNIAQIYVQKSYKMHRLINGTPMPFTLEEELHPLRIAIRAKDTAEG